MLGVRLQVCACLIALAGSACAGVAVQPDEAELREGQPVGKVAPTPLYSAKFVVRATTADAHNLYVSGLRFPAAVPEGEGEDADADERLPTGIIVKVPLLGVPEILAEGPFIPMTTLALVDGRLYWHERHDSPDGRGIRSLSIEGGAIERVSELAGNSWVIHDNVVYFTRPDDEIDEGGFYQLEAGGRPKLVARRRGVVRTLLAGGSGQLYWITRARSDGSWGVYAWDGDKSGTEILTSDETFVSLTIDGDELVWVTWTEDEGEPLHSLYRRALAGGETEVLARKRGMPGFMDVLVDEDSIYLTTVEGGELRRIPKRGGELEILTGSGDRNVAINRFNLFWVADQQVRWMRK